MIKINEMKELHWNVGHTSVNRQSIYGGKKSNRITGSIVRDCLTTITRV